MSFSKLSDRSLDYIYNLERMGKKFGLGNIRRFLKTIGDPHRALRIIHVAGTNGKGSVCAMIQSALMQAGYRVGMFTSPHLTRFNERIRVNNQLISDKDVDRLTELVKKTGMKHRIELTFFETITAMAFIYFKEKKADYIVLETGMGGRLDATNISKPVLSVITNIGKDHRDVLGRTIREITIEKAGIIKKNVTTITNAKNSALKIIAKTCRKNNSKLIKAKDEKLKTSLKGQYQEENAATAAAALRELGIPEDKIRAGLKKTRWPGRFEFLRKNLLVDCAHNPDGIKALASSLKKLKARKLIIIFGVMKKADSKAMAKKLKVLKAKLILTKSDMTNARDSYEIAKSFENAVLTTDLKTAIGFAQKQAGKKDLIVITGSIFLIGEAYRILRM